MALGQGLPRGEQAVLEAIVVDTRNGFHTKPGGLPGGRNVLPIVRKLIKLGFVARTPRKRGMYHATSQALFRSDERDALKTASMGLGYAPQAVTAAA